MKIDTPESAKRIIHADLRRICQDIAADMKADAERFDGMPFNGRVVAEYLGNQGAAIAALARIIDTILLPDPPSVGEPPGAAGQESEP